MLQEACALLMCNYGVTSCKLLPPFARSLLPTGFSVSLPADSVLPVQDDLRPLVSSVPGVAAFPAGEGWLSSLRGLLQFRSRSSAFGVVSASGAVVAAFRAARVYGDFLRLLGSEPHRLTLSRCGS